MSDGIVAPDYEPAALDLLVKKKGGKYCILKVSSYLCNQLILFEADLAEDNQRFQIKISFRGFSMRFKLNYKTKLDSLIF